MLSDLYIWSLTSFDDMFYSVIHCQVSLCHCSTTGS